MPAGITSIRFRRSSRSSGCVPRSSPAAGRAGLERVNRRHDGFTPVNGILNGDEYAGTAVSVMDMEVLYRRFTAPLDIHSSGNIDVNGEYGALPDQIGMLRSRS